MNRASLFFVGIVINAICAYITWGSHPYWAGGCVAGVAYCVADIIRTSFPQPERLSTSSLNYQYGWADGWNACRSAKPEERVFKRADVIGRKATDNKQMNLDV